MNIAGKPGIIDIFFLILFLRMAYIAASRGAVREAVRIGSLLCAVFFAFHFYPVIGEIIGEKAGFINPGYLPAAAFLVIFLTIKTVFFLLDLIIGLFTPKNGTSLKGKILLLGTGFFRAVLLTSTIFFLLNLSPYRPGYIKNSLSYNLFKKASPVFYLFSARIIDRLDGNLRRNSEVEYYLRQDQPAGQGRARL